MMSNLLSRMEKEHAAKLAVQRAQLRARMKILMAEHPGRTDKELIEIIMPNMEAAELANEIERYRLAAEELVLLVRAGDVVLGLAPDGTITVQNANRSD